MRIIPKVKKFQEGGAVVAPVEEEVPVDQGAEAQEAPVEGEAPQQGGGEQDPLMILAQMSAQALQSQDCQLALQVCQAFIQLIQQAQGGGAPAPEQGQPVYKKGGKLAYRLEK